MKPITYREVTEIYQELVKEAHEKSTPGSRITASDIIRSLTKKHVYKRKNSK